MTRKPHDTATGNAGETQQRGGAVLTTNHGIPVSDNQNSLRAGARGPGRDADPQIAGGEFQQRQPRMYWRSMTENEQAHIASAFVFELSKVGLGHVRERMVSHLRVIEEDLGQRVAAGLGIALPEPAKPFRAPLDLAPSDALSIQKNWHETLKGRKVGLLIAEGSDKAGIDRLTSAIKVEGGTVFTIAPKIGPLKLKGGTITPDGQLAGSPSVLFDAIAMILMPDQAERLAKDSAAIGFVMDTFAHLKAIGHCKGSAVILARAGIGEDEGVGPWEDLPDTASRRYWAREAGLRDLA